MAVIYRKIRGRVVPIEVKETQEEKQFKRQVALVSGKPKKELAFSPVPAAKRAAFGFDAGAQLGATVGGLVGSIVVVPATAKRLEVLKAVGKGYLKGAAVGAAIGGAALGLIGLAAPMKRAVSKKTGEPAIKYQPSYLAGAAAVAGAAILGKKFGPGIASKASTEVGSLLRKLRIAKGGHLKVIK